MTQAQLQTTPDGAIVFDPGLSAQATGFNPDFFEPVYWHAQNRLTEGFGGRGGISYVDAPSGQWVLRHYRRGGMIASALGDRYLWTGAGRTRGFAEFHLLAALRTRGLLVPIPVAARYQRRGTHYRADLITRRIEHAATLAESLAHDRCDAPVMARVGAAIARFHAAGAYHADLNAHNVLLTDAQVWLIDFDRGELRQPTRPWQQANLSRLQRSLHKLGASREGEAVFERALWNPLIAAYKHQLTNLSGARG